MSWFLFALICVFGWGLADLFYKKSTDETDKFSQYKIAVWVGLVMGVAAICMLPFSESIKSFGSFWEGFVKYMPASLGYIISMIIGYAGLRYLEVSVVSPVQNSSGALSAIAMIVFFLIRGKEIEYGVLDYIGTAIIVVGVVALAFVEQHLSNKEKTLEVKEEDRKYSLGALALKVYNDLPPSEILSLDPVFFQQIGLNVGLSPTRSNGFASLLKQIYLYARVFDAMSKK